MSLVGVFFLRTCPGTSCRCRHVLEIKQVDAGGPELLLVVPVLGTFQLRRADTPERTGNPESIGGVYGIGVVDRDMEVAVVGDRGGMTEEREVLECQVDPHLRSAVGEGEVLLIRSLRMLVERRHPVYAPRVMAGIEVLLSGLRVLDGQGVVLEIGDELVQGGVSLLQKGVFGWVTIDAMHCSAQLAVGILRYPFHSLRGDEVLDD